MWQLFSFKLTAESRAGRRAEKVWDDEEKLFGKSSSGNLFGDAVRGNIERASAHDTGAGRRKV